MNVRLINRRGMALLALAALAASGCGAVINKNSEQAGIRKSSSSLYAQLPQDVRQRGSIRVVTGDYKVPMDFRAAGGKLVGVNVDLANALQQRLGVKVELVAGTFDSVLGGIASGRYDTAIFTMNDTPEREKLVNFVDYANVPSAIAVPSGNPKTVTGINDSLCGLRVTAKSGEVEATEVQAQSRKCTSAGKEAIDLQLLQDDGSMEQAVLTGRVNAEVSGAEALGYLVKKNPGKLALVPANLGPQPVGMPFRKDRMALTKVVSEAWRQILADGTYAKIAKKWGVTAILPAKIQFNLGAGL